MKKSIIILDPTPSKYEQKYEHTNYENRKRFVFRMFVKDSYFVGIIIAVTGLLIADIAVSQNIGINTTGSSACGITSKIGNR